MELSNNLRIEDLYTPSNDNPNNYWPLDYPPMSAYHAIIFGKLIKFFLPQSILLKESWGYESINHKIMMRLTVLVSDILFFHIPLFLLLNLIFLKKNNNNELSFKNIFRYLASYLMILLIPCLNIIDHGHFQYNCVMHGLYYMSVYHLLKENFAITIIMFSFCINFKQMGMYFSLTFFCYVLNNIIYSNNNQDNSLKNKPKEFSLISHISSIVLKVVTYGIITILTNTLIWSPWIFSGKTYDVFTRIFPIWRGIFEDKVATFWCNLNVIFKLSEIKNNILIISSTAFTLLGSLFSLIILVIYRKTENSKESKLKKITFISFFITSLSFFLFSFHVHEKTILVPLLGFLLCFTFKLIRKISASLFLITLFSLHPLLKRENQEISYFILLVCVYCIAKCLNNVFENQKLKCFGNYINNTILPGNKVIHWTLRYLLELLNLVEYLDIIFIIIYHCCEIYIPPPMKYPWFYPLINSAFSFAHFLLYYIVSNVKIYLIYSK